jgi:hypothetical protein
LKLEVTKNKNCKFGPLNKLRVDAPTVIKFVFPSLTCLSDISILDELLCAKDGVRGSDESCNKEFVVEFSGKFVLKIFCLVTFVIFLYGFITIFWFWLLVKKYFLSRNNLLFSKKFKLVKLGCTCGLVVMKFVLRVNLLKLDDKLLKYNEVSKVESFEVCAGNQSDWEV